jgi:hypothetical protein
VQKNSNGDTLGPGVDLQGEGSLIVVAPSRHKSGGVYNGPTAVRRGSELAPLPAWVLALVDARQPAAPRPANSSGHAAGRDMGRGA